MKGWRAETLALLKYSGFVQQPDYTWQAARVTQARRDLLPILGLAPLIDGCMHALAPTVPVVMTREARFVYASWSAPWAYALWKSLGGVAQLDQRLAGLTVDEARLYHEVWALGGYHALVELFSHLRP